MRRSNVYYKKPIVCDMGAPMISFPSSAILLIELSRSSPELFATQRLPERVRRLLVRDVRSMRMKGSDLRVAIQAVAELWAFEVLWVIGPSGMGLNGVRRLVLLLRARVAGASGLLLDLVDDARHNDQVVRRSVYGYVV